MVVLDDVVVLAVVVGAAVVVVVRGRVVVVVRGRGSWSWWRAGSSWCVGAAVVVVVGAAVVVVVGAAVVVVVGGSTWADTGPPRIASEPMPSTSTDAPTIPRRTARRCAFGVLTKWRTFGARTAVAWSRPVPDTLPPGALPALPPQRWWRGQE